VTIDRETYHWARVLSSEVATARAGYAVLAVVGADEVVRYAVVEAPLQSGDSGFWQIDTQGDNHGPALYGSRSEADHMALLLAASEQPTCTLLPDDGVVETVATVGADDARRVLVRLTYRDLVGEGQGHSWLHDVQYARQHARFALLKQLCPWKG
jgi:hypothetical protein